MKKPVNSLSASVNQKQFWIEIRLDVSRKQFQDQAQQSYRTWSGSKQFDTEGISDWFFFAIFLKKGHFEENQKMTLLKIHTNLPSM